MSRKIIVVVGKNFGDEGKGLATAHFTGQSSNHFSGQSTNHFSGQSSNALVIKHNGGAQAGHTVDRTDGRFVFHQLSSGSFHGATTFLSATFLPDLLKLPEEAEAFRKGTGKVPPVYIDAQCRLTTVFDAVLNAFTESVRAGARHGSCGMGINETVIRNENSEYALSLAEFESFSPREAGLFLEKIRTEYVPSRLRQLSMRMQEGNEWCDLLLDRNVAWNAADAMKTASRYFSTVHDAKELLQGAENLVFEGAQGLLLDRNNDPYRPYLTPSDTGSKNPFALLKQCKITYDKTNTEVCYVTRSYVTRHGAGPLPHECDRADISPRIHDETNVENQWQESLRFARHPQASEFVRAVAEDQKNYIDCIDDIDYIDCSDPEDSKPCEGAEVSLMVTHLNETDGKIVTTDGDTNVEAYLNEGGQGSFFDRIYTSFTPFAGDIRSAGKL